MVANPVSDQVIPRTVGPLPPYVTFDSLDMATGTQVQMQVPMKYKILCPQRQEWNLSVLKPAKSKFGGCGLFRDSSIRGQRKISMFFFFSFALSTLLPVILEFWGIPGPV